MLKPLRITGSAEDGEWPERDMHVYDFHCIFSLKKRIWTFCVCGFSMLGNIAGSVSAFRRLEI
jgi:hypothetical protein